MDKSKEQIDKHMYIDIYIRSIYISPLLSMYIYILIHAHTPIFCQLAWTLKEHKSLEHEVWPIGGHQEGHRAEPH